MGKSTSARDAGICRSKGCSDTMIQQCASESGGLKELLFCQQDGCFVIKVDGEERLRTDTQDIAANAFARA